VALALLVSFQALLPEAPPIAARAAERGRAVRGFDVPSDVSLVLGSISTFQALPALVSRVLLHEVVVGRLRGVRPQDRSRNTLLSDGCSVSGEYYSAADADVTPPEAVLGFLFFGIAVVGVCILLPCCPPLSPHLYLQWGWNPVTR